MPNLVSIDGRLLDEHRAGISVLDRGFLYGDSVYEVLRAYRGVPFELESHLERLQASGERIGLKKIDISALGQELQAALAASGLRNAYVRLVVTRGGGPLSLDPSVAEKPVRLVYVRPPRLPAPDAYEMGIVASIVSTRRNLKDAIDPAAKTGNYLNSVVAVQEARASGAEEAFMLDHRGLVTEGASSNIFAVYDKVLVTPPVDGILPGITRKVVMKIAGAAGYRVVELPIHPEGLKNADEVFITSTMREILGVRAVDEATYSAPGPATQAIRQKFAEAVDRYVRTRGGDDT